VLSFDYLRQESIRKFLRDSGRTGRPKSIIIDGCVMVHELLVIGLATRTGSTPEAVRKKHGKLRPLARLALTATEDGPLRDVILAIAEVRNAAAHETISDDDIQERFIKVWSKVSGGTPWPDSLPLRSSYCRALFSLIGFELGRWQVGLAPSGHFSGEVAVDWRHLVGG
jgi:hypothetical protein